MLADARASPCRTRTHNSLNRIATGTQPPAVDTSLRHALGNIAAAGAVGGALGFALNYAAFKPAVGRVEELIQVASKTSGELRATIDAWNALDEPGRNAVKMQLQGRLAALEASSEANAKSLAALSKKVDDVEGRQFVAAAVSAAALAPDAPPAGAKPGAAGKAAGK